MGDGCELDVQSAAAFAQRNEELSYWQLQVCANFVRGLLSQWPSAASTDPGSGYRPLKNSLMRARILRFVLTILSDVQARAQSVGRILFGFYAVPDSSSVPIDFVINLEGNEERSKKRCSH